MGTFYKAVRPDGTDFFSGTVDYAGICGTDQTLPVLPPCIDPECCSADVYHASVSKADTLIGGSWPCRLFEVEGEPVDEEGTKRGFYTLKVLRELPAHEALGPNGVALLELFTEAEALTWEQATKAPEQWKVGQGVSSGRRMRMMTIDGSLHDLAEDFKRGAALDIVEHHVRDLVVASLPYKTSGMLNDVTARGRTRYAARMAARALVVKDMLGADDFQMMIAPWNKVMGRET